MTVKPTHHINVYSLGLLDYQQAFKLQDVLLQKRINGDIPDTLLLLEHPPTLTMGKSDDVRNLRVPESHLKAQGIATYSTDRGGSITWHGPGQLVGYPIIDLADRNKDLHRYIRDLEETIIQMLAGFGIRSGRDKINIGVWVGREKIAAIGVRIRKWVTKHGFAVNVNSDLTHFSLINPCGITGRGVTSMARVLGRDVPMADVRTAVIDAMGAVFGVPTRLGSEDISAFS